MRPVVIGDNVLLTIKAASENATSSPIKAANAAEEVIGVIAHCRIMIV